MILASCNYMLQDIRGQLIRARVAFHNPYRRRQSAWNPFRATAPALEAFLFAQHTGNSVGVWASILGRKAFLPRRKSAFLRLCDEIGADPLIRTVMAEYMPEQVIELALLRDTRLLREFRMKGRSGQWDYAIDVYASGDYEPRLVIGTIHSVKGAEADHVVLFPDLSPAGYREWVSFQRRDRILRLFYVGMTRARERLLLCDSQGQYAIRWRG